LTTIMRMFLGLEKLYVDEKVLKEL
jgi:hypothetical protein